MAIKISVDGKISKILPGTNNYFDINAMEEIVEGWPYPMKIGPVWVIQNEDLYTTQKNINNLASRFFCRSIFGEVFIVSSHELPPSWDLLDDFDNKYSAEIIDSGFIKAITEMVINENYYLPIDYSYTKNQNFTKKLKNEYIYSPENQNKSTDEFKDFLREGIDYITSNEKEFVIFEDENNIVRVKGKKDQVKTLEQMLEIFVEEENYEAAAKIRDFKLFIEKNED